jgi:hypothetical protein
VIVIIDPDQTFRDERKRGVSGTSYYLVEVPKEVLPSQFSTLRQAEALGGKIIFNKGKSP